MEPNLRGDKKKKGERAPPPPIPLRLDNTLVVENVGYVCSFFSISARTRNG